MAHWQNFNRHIQIIKMTAKKSKIHEYEVDVDFYSILYRVKAKTAGEARKKVRAKIRKGVAAKEINHMYTDRIDN